MPLNEIETHPYLDLGLTLNATKLILGSFPVYECTDKDNPKKMELRKQKGSERFFYGSNKNKFWEKYSNYVDNSIARPWIPQKILSSLITRNIAISDTIISCERYLASKNKTDQFSSADSALHKKTLNEISIIRLIDNGVVKIMSTSKGVIKTLEKIIIKNGGSIDMSASKTLQTEFLSKLNGEPAFVSNPIALVFKYQGKRVSSISIPSPGSPQRQLKSFGFNHIDSKTYADLYFENAFKWLND